jgi:glycosyltransferase involved in cell wall biosynthesis
MFPHYRAPVLRALARSKLFDFRFWGSHEPVDGIKSFSGDEAVAIKPLRTVRTSRGFNVYGMMGAILYDRPEVVIILGNPNIVQTWYAAIFARARGVKVLFWAHGWLKQESFLKSKVRNLYFAISHGVLVYGDRARVLAKSSGYNADKVFPIYNSLEWDLASKLYNDLDAVGGAASVNNLDVHDGVPLLICTARLTQICRFDLLLDAMSLLRQDGMNTALILVGDGPERAALEAQAIRLELDVKFLGAIYDEQRLAELLYSADVTVSPGKVGLTAMHSLTYGTPVVTHSDLDEQMPEVEAIVEGKTGAFFRRGDVDDLAAAIHRVVRSSTPRHAVRQYCRESMSARYTPERQRQFIEQSVERVLGSLR